MISDTLDFYDDMNLNSDSQLFSDQTLLAESEIWDAYVQTTPGTSFWLDFARAVEARTQRKINEQQRQRESTISTQCQ